MRDWDTAQTARVMVMVLVMVGERIARHPPTATTTTTTEGNNNMKKKKNNKELC